MKHVYIRVDGNEIIATGHVMRCLSIAEQVRKLGTEVTFVLADERPKELIERRGFAIAVLGTIWNDLNQEIDVFRKFINEHDVKVVLLDSYYVTPEYMQAISSITRLIYMDDLRKFLYPANTLIAYWAFIEEEAYMQPYKEQGKDTAFLLGGSYVPLREEFSYVPFEVREKVERVLITTGGTDQLNVAGQLLRYLMNKETCCAPEYHVIVGCFNQNKEELLSLQAQYNNIHLHENVTNMSAWMRACDVAISAAGTTTYELCACGIPTICLEIADNQEGAVCWQEQGYMRYAGNAYKDMGDCLKNCEIALLEYVMNYEERERISKRMQALVDGCGARRIAEHMLDL